MKRKVVFSLMLMLGVTACGSDDTSTSATTEPVNLAPQISLVIPDNIVEKTAVVIAAGASDSDGSISSYSWTQIAGPEVEFDSNKSSLNFMAPSITQVTSFSFALAVTDDDGASTNEEFSFELQRNETELTLVGSVIPTKYVDGTIHLSYGGDSSVAVIDSQGNYSLTILVDDDTPATTVAKYTAKADDEDPIALVALQSPLIVAANTTELNQVSIETNANTIATGQNLSVLSTATYSMLINTNQGEPINDQATMVSIETQLDFNKVLEAAAVAQLLIEGKAEMPADITDMSVLLADDAQYSSIVTNIESQSPGLIAETALAIATDSVNLPNIENDNIPESFYISTAAAPTFVNHGVAALYSLSANGDGSLVGIHGQNQFKWQLEDSALKLTDFKQALYENYEFVSEDMGFTAAEVELLYNNGYQQIRVQYASESQGWTLLSVGSRIDNYRVHEVITASSDIMTIAGVDYQVNQTKDYVYYRQIIKSVPTDYQFTAEMFTQPWIMPVYDGPEQLGSYTGILSEQVTFSADNKGTTGFTNKAFSWSIEDGVLVMQFDGFRQHILINTINGTDFGVSVEVISSERHFMTGNLMTTIDVPDSFTLVTGLSQYWQTFANEWAVRYWDGNRLKFCEDESSYQKCHDSFWTMFGFQFKDESQAQRLIPIDILATESEQFWVNNLEVTYDGTNVRMDYIYDDSPICDGNDNSYCRYREWQLIKTMDGRLGQRIYVLEYDKRTQVYSGETVVINIGPRINIYEKIDLDYFVKTAPESIKANSNGVAMSRGSLLPTLNYHGFKIPELH